MRLDTDAARTKDFLGRSEVEVHVGEVKLLLAFRLVYLVVLLAEVGVALLHLAPCAILGRRHHDRRGEPRVAHSIADDVAVECIVVLHLVSHVLRTV